MFRTSWCAGAGLERSQCQQELSTILVSFSRILREAGITDRSKTGRNSRWQRRRWLAQHRRGKLERRAAFEGLPACDQFVQHDAEGPHIAARVGALPAEYFGGKIAQSPGDDAGFRQC